MNWEQPKQIMNWEPPKQYENTPDKSPQLWDATDPIQELIDALEIVFLTSEVTISLSLPPDTPDWVDPNEVPCTMAYKKWDIQGEIRLENNSSKWLTAQIPLKILTESFSNNKTFIFARDIYKYTWTIWAELSGRRLYTYRWTLAFAVGLSRNWPEIIKSWFVQRPWVRPINDIEGKAITWPWFDPVIVRRNKEGKITVKHPTIVEKQGLYFYPEKSYPRNVQHIEWDNPFYVMPIQ